MKVLLVTLALGLASPSPSPLVGMGALDKEVIRGVIRKHLAEVKSCYERGLERRDMSGRVMVRFTIESTGRVSKAFVQSTTLEDAGVESCICASVMRWTFPEPIGGARVIVSYPFMLKMGEVK